MLSNVYLHEVLDGWFKAEVKPRLKGKAFLIRYADDAVLVFERKWDAERVMEVLPKRFGKYGLAIHPDKTRLIWFGKPQMREGGMPETPRWEKFSFLGFTHYWGRSRKGVWAVKRKTDLRRFTRALRSIAMWCRCNRHRPIGEQQRVLSLKLRGHYAYYGITGNAACLRSYLLQVERTWQKWLSRRSRGGPMPWERFKQLLLRYPLPPARVVHSVFAARP
jgi:hypothetical protein